MGERVHSCSLSPTINPTRSRMICECEEPTLFPKECPPSCIIRWVAEEGKGK